MKILEVTFLDSTSEKVLARADVHFEGFILKGFKVFRHEKTKEEYVTPPSYLSKSGWRPLFKTDTIDDWQYICSRIIEEFNKKQINDSLEGK